MNVLKEIEFEIELEGDPNVGKKSAAALLKGKVNQQDEKNQENQIASLNSVLNDFFGKEGANITGNETGASLKG